jgi:hypothetical protein
MMTPNLRKPSNHLRARRPAAFVAAVLFLGIADNFVKPLHAQGFVSVGAGVGGGVGDRNKDASGRGAHGAVYVQARIPVIPFALRADALFAKTVNDASALSLIGDAVVIAPIPFVQPYVLAGYGRYGIGKDGSASGWNVGVGARVRTPWVGIYAEARRHQRISRDLLTIGISR